MVDAQWINPAIVVAVLSLMAITFPSQSQFEAWAEQVQPRSFVVATPSAAKRKRISNPQPSTLNPQPSTLPMTASADTIRQVVQEVLSQLGKSSKSLAGSQRNGDWGVFQTVDQAVAAATDGFEKFSDAPLAHAPGDRSSSSTICVTQAENSAAGARRDEDRPARSQDREAEDPRSSCPASSSCGTDAFSGDHGLTLIEYAPFGVIGAITPVTHSLPTLAGNAVNMIAAGNTLVVNPHPSGSKHRLRRRPPRSTRRSTSDSASTT